MDAPATSDADEQARRTLVRPCSSQADLSFTRAFAGCYQQVAYRVTLMLYCCLPHAPVSRACPFTRSSMSTMQLTLQWPALQAAISLLSKCALAIFCMCMYGHAFAGHEMLHTSVSTQRPQLLWEAQLRCGRARTQSCSSSRPCCWLACRVHALRSGLDYSMQCPHAHSSAWRPCAGARLKQ